MAFFNRIKVITEQGIGLSLYKYNIASNLESAPDCKYALTFNTFIRVCKIILRVIGTYSNNFFLRL